MKTFAIALASLITLNSALPATSQAPGDVLICTGENYTGDCETLSVPFNACQILSAPFTNNVGSFKPAPGAFCRITYTADTCTSHGDAFVDPTPAAPTLHHFENPQGEIIDAGKSLTSFLCQECTGCA